MKSKIILKAKPLLHILSGTLHIFHMQQNFLHISKIIQHKPHVYSVMKHSYYFSAIFTSTGRIWTQWTLNDLHPHYFVHKEIKSQGEYPLPLPSYISYSMGEWLKLIFNK